MRVLVIEDTESIAALLEVTLEAHGHEVTTVTSGFDALTAETMRGHAAVVADFRLDGATVNGCDLLALVEPGVTTVLLSAFVDGPSGLVPDDCPATARLAKPIDTAALLEALAP